MTCPNCRIVMCEQFDQIKQNNGPFGSSLMVPNGKYICYRCGHTEIKTARGPEE